MGVTVRRLWLPIQLNRLAWLVGTEYSEGYQSADGVELVFAEAAQVFQA